MHHATSQQFTPRPGSPLVPFLPCVPCTCLSLTKRCRIFRLRVRTFKRSTCAGSSYAQSPVGSPLVSTAVVQGFKSRKNSSNSSKPPYLQRFTPSPSHLRFLFVQKSHDPRSLRPGARGAWRAVFSPAAVGKLLSGAAVKFGFCCGVNIPAKALRPCPRFALLSSMCRREGTADRRPRQRDTTEPRNLLRHLIAGSAQQMVVRREYAHSRIHVSPLVCSRQTASSRRRWAEALPAAVISGAEGGRKSRGLGDRCSLGAGQCQDLSIDDNEPKTPRKHCAAQRPARSPTSASLASCAHHGTALER